MKAERDNDWSKEEQVIVEGDRDERKQEREGWGDVQGKRIILKRTRDYFTSFPSLPFSYSCTCSSNPFLTLPLLRDAHCVLVFLYILSVRAHYVTPLQSIFLSS